MRKLFKECGEEISGYDSEYDWLKFYYIADEENFKKQVTISDYYRILLVDNAGNLTACDLNKKLQEIKDNDSLFEYCSDTYEEVMDMINARYDLNLEFNYSLYYSELDYFKHGYIVYDKDNKCFDDANKWDEVVITFSYMEEHGYIATMEIEVENENLESPYHEVHIDEFDEIEEYEIENDSDEAEDEEDYILNQITVTEKRVVETTTVKKLDDDKYLIVISSKLPGHIDLACIVTEKELKMYLEEEYVKDLGKYLEMMNAK